MCNMWHDNKRIVDWDGQKFAASWLLKDISGPMSSQMDDISINNRFEIGRLEKYVLILTEEFWSKEDLHKGSTGFQ